MADLFLLAVGDLYISIGQLIRSDVVVQTWGCQTGYDVSYCIPNLPQVFNIKTIKTALEQWPPTKDHSKWCMSANFNNHVVCIADVNRSTTQYERYGGALCFSNERVKEIFINFVGEIEQCGTPIIRDTTNTDCDTMDVWAGSVSKEGKLGFSMVSEGDSETSAVFSASGPVNVEVFNSPKGKCCYDGSWKQWSGLIAVAV